MTQEPSPSGPRRDAGRDAGPDAVPTMAVDPLTGEPLSGWSVAGGPGLTKPGRSSGGSRAETSEAAQGAPVADGAAAYPPPYYGPPVYPPPSYGPPAYPPPSCGPPGYPPPGYGAGPYPPAGHPLARPTNGLAVASLVLGAVWMFWIGSVLALVLGHVARGQIRRTGEEGDGIAVAGIVLGWVGVGLLVLLIAIGVLGDS